MSDFAGEGGGYSAGQHQAGIPKTAPFGSHQLQQAMTGHGAAGMSGHGAHPGQPPQPPREVTSISEELLTRPFQDIGNEFKTSFSLNRLLEIDPKTDTPEEQARKQQIHSKWQTLTQSEQQVAQATYQRHMQEKHQREQAEMMQQRQKQMAEQSFVIPQGQTKGPDAGGGGNRKKMMTQQVNSNRQSFNKIQSSG